MIRPSRRRMLVLTFAICFAQGSAPLHAGEIEPSGGGRLRKTADPAEALGGDTLSDADVKTLTRHFEQLASPDFDERQKAEAAILAYGPRAAPVARTFESSGDPDTRVFARRFHQSVILNFRGYLPVSAELRETLAAPRRIFIGKRETFRAALDRLLKDSELTAAFGWKNCPERIVGGNDTTEKLEPTGEALQFLLNYANVVAVPRGRGIAIATPEQAKQLVLQDHAFALASLDRDGRARLAEALAIWLPATEVSVNDGGILMRGQEGDLRTAARAIYFVAPDALQMPALAGSSRIFPKSPGRAASQALFAALEAPVAELSLLGIEPLRGIARLRAAGHPVAADDASADLAPRQPAVILELRDIPLGLALRWMAARANYQAPPAAPAVQAQAWLELHCSAPEQKGAGIKPLILAKLVSSQRMSPAPEAVLGADVAFLYTPQREKLPAADADREVLADLAKQLGDELALFPCYEHHFALTMFNRRLLARGPDLLLARLDELVEAWRAGTVPTRPKWRAEFDRKLERQIDWNGTGFPANTLLQRLGEASSLNILLDRPVPGAPAFKMDMGAAELLKPGKHRAKDLIQRLSEVSTSMAVLRWGVVVLIPAQETPQQPPFPAAPSSARVNVFNLDEPISKSIEKIERRVQEK